MNKDRDADLASLLRAVVDGEALVVRGGFLPKAELGKAMAGHDHSH